MSYDIFLQKLVNGNSGICTSREAQACVNLLNTVTSDKPDEDNFLVLEFEDGLTVEVSGWEDEKAISGCTFFTRGISQALLEFIFNMAVAGNFVILSSGEDTPESPVAFATSQDVLDGIGEDIFKHPRLCTNVSELAKFLGVGYDNWSDYRDYVMDSKPDETPPSPKKTPFLKRLFRGK